MYQQFIIFFLLLLTGYLCKKFNIITEEMTSGLNKFIILVSYPCMILSRTAVLEIDHNIFSNFMLTLVINIGILLLFALYAYLYCKARKFSLEDAPVIEFAIISPNNGFMGFPIALMFFGSMGLLYMIACNIALNFFFFTYGIILMKRGQNNSSGSIKKKMVDFILLMVNPKVSAAIVGIIFCYNHFKLPEFLMSFLTSVGDVAPPMAMISIGTTFAGSLGFSILKKKPIVEASLNKLFIIPLIAIVVVFFLPLDPMVKMVLIISNALPVATTVPILSEQYKRNKLLAGETLIISTLLSMATVPLFLWLIPTILQ